MQDSHQVVRDRNRLAAVRRLVLLDTPPSPPFDRLTRMAATLLGCPISLLTIIDARRQWFKSSYGLPEPIATERETSLDHSLCQYTVGAGARFVVSDATTDPDLRDHRAVRELGLRAYAGAPLWSPDGHAVGTLCVADLEAREWDEHQLRTLDDLAEIGTRELALNVHERLDARRRVFGSAPNGITTWS